MEVEYQWYCTGINHGGDEIVISFLLAPPCQEQEQVKDNVAEMEGNPEPPEKDSFPVEHTKLEERNDTWKAYGFEKVEWSPFMF